jgi:hypothetical protein
VSQDSFEWELFKKSDDILLAIRKRQRVKGGEKKASISGEN